MDQPIISITGCGEQNAVFPLTDQQAALAARLLQIVYEGPAAPAYAALAELAGGEGRIN